MRLFRRDINLIGVARKVRQECDRRFILTDNATPVFAFSLQNILEQDSSRFCQMPLRNSRLRLDGFEDKVCGVNLTVRVWIRNADRFAFVLENQDVIDFFAASKIDILLQPDS